MNTDIPEIIVEKVIKFLRRENIEIAMCEIREKTSRYEIFIKPHRNITGLRRIKIIVDKRYLKYRVYTNIASFDLKLKKIINREISKMVVGNEITPQKENTGSDITTRRPS